jgi:hypothetical protein
LGNFLEHLVGAQNPKGLKTPLKTTQPPAQTNTESNPNNIEPTIYKKNGRKMKKLKKLITGRKKGKNELPANGRPAVDGLVGEGPAVVLRWWGKRLVEVGRGSLDV